MRQKIDKFPGLNELDNASVPLGVDQKLVFRIDENGNLRPGWKTKTPTVIEQEGAYAINPAIEDFTIYKWWEFKNSDNEIHYIAHYYDPAEGYGFAKSIDRKVWDYLNKDVLDPLYFSDTATAAVIIDDTIYITSKADGIWKWDSSGTGYITLLTATGARCLCTHLNFLVAGNFTDEPNKIKYGTEALPDDFTGRYLTITKDGGSIVGLASFNDMKERTILPSLAVLNSEYIHILNDFSSNTVNRRISTVGMIPETLQEQKGKLVWMGKDNQIYRWNLYSGIKKKSMGIENYLGSLKPKNQVNSIVENYYEMHETKEGGTMPLDWMYDPVDKLLPEMGEIEKEWIGKEYENERKKYTDHAIILNKTTGATIYAALKWEVTYPLYSSKYISGVKKTIGIDIISTEEDGTHQYSENAWAADVGLLETIRVFMEQWNDDRIMLFASISNLLYATTSSVFKTIAPSLPGGTLTVTANTIETTTTTKKYYFPIGDYDDKYYYQIYDHATPSVEIKYFESTFSQTSVGTISEAIRLFHIGDISGATMYLGTENTGNQKPDKDVRINSTTANETFLYLYEITFPGGTYTKTKISDEKYGIWDAKIYNENVLALTKVEKNGAYEAIEYSRGDPVLMPLNTEVLERGRTLQPDRIEGNISKVEHLNKDTATIIWSDGQVTVEIKSGNIIKKYRHQPKRTIEQTNKLENITVENYTANGIKISGWTARASSSLEFETKIFSFPLLTQMRFIRILYDTLDDNDQMYYKTAAYEGGIPGASWTALPAEGVKFYGAKGGVSNKFWKFKIITANLNFVMTMYKGLVIEYKTSEEESGDTIMSTSIEGEYVLVLAERGYAIFMDSKGIFYPGYFPENIQAICNDRIIYDDSDGAHQYAEVQLGDEILYRMKIKYADYYQFKEALILADKIKSSAAGTVTINNYAFSPEVKRTLLPFTVQGRDIEVIVNTENWDVIRNIYLEGKIIPGR